MITENLKITFLSLSPKNKAIIKADTKGRKIPVTDSIISAAKREKPKSVNIIIVAKRSNVKIIPVPKI